MCLKILRDGIERDADLYRTIRQGIYDPSGTLSTGQIALVVSFERDRFVCVLGPKGCGWIPVEEVFVLLKYVGAISLSHSLSYSYE